MAVHHVDNRLLRRPTRVISRLSFWAASLMLAAACSVVGFAQTVSKPYIVTISDEKTQVVETILPVDPKIRIQLNSTSGMAYGLMTPDRKKLTFSSGSARTLLKINNQRIYPSGNRRPLKPKKRSKIPRYGWKYTYVRGNVKVTQTQEVVPSKLLGEAKPGQKRKMDAVLIKYVVENFGTAPVKFALRVRIDMYNWTTDGPAFWAPTTLPKKILDGVVLKGKKIPDYLISIQHRNLRNPGHLAYFTFNLGKKYEMPVKVIPTSHGARDLGWEVQATPNRFDTDIVLYWAEKDLKPKQKRVIVYGYGTGIATPPQPEGRVTLVPGGSFEPGKRFTLTAYVDDPLQGQYLKLNLPKGMQLLEGKETQPVPAPNEENRSLVVWKGRVLHTGSFPLQVYSSNGVTLTKTVAVQKAN